MKATTRAVSMVLLFGVLLLTESGRGQPVPLGPDFQVNTYTTEMQDYPGVAVDADGGFVVVWHSYGSSGSDSSDSSIQGQRFDWKGAPVGDEFQVNTLTTSLQEYPSIAVNADGDFAVVWESFVSAGSDSSSRSIQGQLFDSAGAPSGDQFQVNSYTTNGQRIPIVAFDADGDFLVVWSSDGSSGTDTSGTSIQGRFFDSAGVPFGEEFQLNTYTSAGQAFPSVAFGPDGGFVAVWNSLGSSGSDTSESSIQGQRFDSAGAKIGGEFQVNTYTTSWQVRPAVKIDSGGSFVVIWTSWGSNGSDSSYCSIQGQRFSALAVPVGDQLQVNTYTTAEQQLPSLAMDAEGDFVVVWQSAGSSGSDSSTTSIQGQLFDSAGLPVGQEFQVNSYTLGVQAEPYVAMNANSELVVVWTSIASSGSDTFYSVQARRFVVPLFTDGFEAGDTSAWSTTVP